MNAQDCRNVFSQQWPTHNTIRKSSLESCPIIGNSSRKKGQRVMVRMVRMDSEVRLQHDLNPLNTLKYYCLTKQKNNNLINSTTSSAICQTNIGLSPCISEVFYKRK